MVHKEHGTGLTMNFHALAPRKCKKSVVSGFFYRIYRACSTWKCFHQGLEKTKKILRNNQYPPSFYEPIITKILSRNFEVCNEQNSKPSRTDDDHGKLVFLQYRGKISEEFERSLIRCEAPCQLVFTLQKLRSVLPSLKPHVDMFFKSGVVYKITCSRCKLCYVGQTSRHLLNRIEEHKRKNSPVGIHFDLCKGCFPLSRFSHARVRTPKTLNPSTRYIF